LPDNDRGLKEPLENRIQPKDAAFMLHGIAGSTIAGEVFQSLLIFAANISLPLHMTALLCSRKNAQRCA
jgi:hypothetical protein